MATSGSTDWSLNRDQVITAALRKLVVLPSGGVPSANQISDATDSLNALVKTLAADGMPLWKVNSTSFTVTAGVDTYNVGPSQTINCPKPIRIFQAFYTLTGSVNIPMNVYNRYDFNLLPTNNTVTGTPINFYYQPFEQTGAINLWPIPQDSTTLITFNYYSQFEDMLSSTDDFDFPNEWVLPLIYMLASLMAPEYGIPIMDRQQLQKEAEYWHQYVLSMGDEEGSIFLKPGFE